MPVPDPSWAWRLGLHAQDLDADGHDTLGGSSDAADISIADAGGYFSGGDVEAALQELAAQDRGYQAHGNTGSTETFDASVAGWHSATLNANCTFTFSGATSGVVAGLVLELTNDTGSRTVTWPGSVVWPGGVAPTLSTAAGAVDVLTFFTRDGGTIWYGFPTGGTGSSVALSDDDPLPDGAADPGVSTEASRSDHVHPAVAAGGVILLADGHGTPFTFDDLLQRDDGEGFLYADA